MTRRLTRLGLVCLTVAALSAVAASAAAAKTVTKTAAFNQCVSTAVPTVARGAIAATINVPVPKNGKKVQDGTVTAFTTVGTRITHTADNNLTLNLVSPAGKAIALATHRGSSGDGFGTGEASCAGSQLLFGDTFGTPIATPGNTANNPIVGAFKPEQPLSTFVGGPARGAWTLLVSDDATVHQPGSINAFSLSFTYTFKKPLKKKK